MRTSPPEQADSSHMPWSKQLGTPKSEVEELRILSSELPVVLNTALVYTYPCVVRSEMRQQRLGRGTRTVWAHTTLSAHGTTWLRVWVVGGGWD